MKLKSIQFRNFRRFTDLQVQGLPQQVRLIVLAGPNGVGKSSFFDGLMTWHRRRVWNQAHGTEIYSAKLGMSDSSNHYDRVTVELHDHPSNAPSLKETSIYFRTAYRHEVEFQVQSIGQQKSPILDGGRGLRAVDVDQSVSENYQRLLWQTFSAVYDESTPDSATKAEIRDRLVGRLREALSRVFPDLQLTRVGAIGKGSSFEFSKGASVGFPYVNLSAGEKAVFDLLLDAVVKAEFFRDASWCIDEPELHVGTSAQGLLLRELLDLVPPSSQLLLASHSLGFMSEAVRLAQEAPGEVVFLDFGAHDFDSPVVMEPVTPTRDFWKGTLEVALADLAQLVAPNRVVLCEGSVGSFDARCYRTVFADFHPDTDFVSVGNSDDASRDRVGITSALQAITPGTEVIRLRDRDLATAGELAEWRASGVRTLRRRHLESYLYDEEVLDALCEHVGKPEAKAEVRAARSARLAELSARGKDSDDMKAASGPLYTDIRKILGIANAGTTARAFAEQYLAPLVGPELKVYAELESDIFGDDS